MLSVLNLFLLATLVISEFKIDIFDFIYTRERLSETLSH